MAEVEVVPDPDGPSTGGAESERPGAPPPAHASGPELPRIGRPGPDDGTVDDEDTGGARDPAGDRHVEGVAGSGNRPVDVEVETEGENETAVDVDADAEIDGLLDEGTFDDSVVPHPRDWTPEQLERLRRFIESDD